ncbi:MAG: MATE family efflux transporter [Roseicyclus sp.]
MTLAQHIRATLTIGGPLIGGQLAQTLITLTDTVMMGWYGVEELAAVALGGSYFHVILIVGMGFGLAVMPLVAAASSGGNAAEVRRVTRMGLWLGILFGLAVLPVFWFSGAILSALGQTPQVAADAQTYLRIAGFGILPAVLGIVLRSHLSALERPRVVLWAWLGGAGLNAFLNWVLIFGNLGAPELGITGAALASVGTHALIFAVLATFAARARGLSDYTLFARFWRPDWPVFVTVFRLGWPIGLTLLAESGLFVGTMVMMGWIGTMELAAHGIAIQIISLTFMVHVGLASAATVRAGRAWGRQDREALRLAADRIRGAKKLAGLVGDLAPTEAAFALKELVEGQGGSVECRTDGAKLPAGNRSAYVGTSSIEDIDEAQAVMLIGTNPRMEAPVLNARIRKAWLKGATVGLIGPAVDLTYDVDHIGTDRAALERVVNQDHGDEIREKPSIVIVGQGAIREADGEAVLAAAMRLAGATGSGLLVLHTAAGRVGAMDVGAVTEGGMDAAVEGADVIYNLGADEVEIADGAFVIYQGSHGDQGAHRADVILPAAAYPEEAGLFVNTEGRPQLAFRASFPPGEARENWAILRALSAELGATQPWNSLPDLRRALVQAVPHLGLIDEVPENDWQTLEAGPLGDASFRPAVTDHYLVNPIARASTLMAEQSAAARARAAAPLAAE